MCSTVRPQSALLSLPRVTYVEKLSIEAAAALLQISACCSFISPMLEFFFILLCLV
jgi:hypothetical protein